MSTEFRDAILSDEHPPRHRLVLIRSWAPVDHQSRLVLFVGLNPSMADASNDDMTVAKCRGFTQKWGYNAFHIVNLYTLRATKPTALTSELQAGREINHADADRAIVDCARVADLIVACWGSWPGPDPLRPDAVRALVGDRWNALGFTRDGHPRHPSRIAYTTELERWPLGQELPPVPPEDANDVCGDCGHLRSSHRPTGGCTAFVPGQPLKTIDRRLNAIERVTEIAVTSKGKAHASQWTSSVCPCQDFTPSGMRFVTEEDDELALAVREGRRRRTVLPIAEL